MLHHAVVEPRAIPVIGSVHLIEIEIVLELQKATAITVAMAFEQAQRAFGYVLAIVGSGKGAGEELFT